MKRWATTWAGLGLAAATLGHAAIGQTVLSVDASAPVPAPREGVLHLGSAVAPGGATLGANSRYLTLNGHPWLPVMGEFHYSRSPAASWAAELRKMKAAGITIVSTYVIWNHHEAQAGHFDWQGNRDLRRFVQLAQQAGLDVVVRIGPWDHAEARFGGVPDWVVDTMPTRRDDAEYLRYVQRFYEQIGAQLHGLMWKDGGPIVGVQIENEYNLDGPGQGAQHIATLKKLARGAGFDVPFYTVTGWDGAVYPSGEVTPVFGGYPDEPWGTTTTELPPKETYAFRFDSRVSGDLGAQTAAHAPGTAERDADSTPFLGAEFGAGLPAMYRRRTLVSPDDIAAMLPVQLGSGVNLMGYYMFHGGRNPEGLPSLEESSGSGGYNDTPRISYDFQAPLGPDGQQREVLARLRPFHLFLAAFGDRLAPMTVRKPDMVPTSPADLSTPRWSVRASDDSGFVFVSNHVRQYAMPVLRDVQFKLRLSHEALQFPSQPVSIADGDYFIWPFNFDMDGTRLRWATAQPLTRLDAGAQGIVYVFAASGSIPAEFATDSETFTVAPSLALRPVGHVGKRPLSVLVLSPQQSRELLVGTLEGRPRLVLSEAQAWFDAQGLQLHSVDATEQRVAIFPALEHAGAKGAALQTQSADGAFQSLALRWTARTLRAEITPLRAADEAPPVLKGGLAGAALAPIPEAFKAAAAWTITLPAKALDGLDDVLIEPDFTGDIGRLFSQTRLLDDWYLNGQPWQIGLKRLTASLHGPLTLTVLPLRADAPVYIDRAHRPDFAREQQLAQLHGVRLHPVYAAQLH